MKNVKPHGEMVLLEFIEVEKAKETYKANKAGLLVKTEADDKKKYQAVVRDIGNEVDVTKITWKVGDIVVYNDYGCMKFGDEDHYYGIIKKSDVWASYVE